MSLRPEALGVVGVEPADILVSFSASRGFWSRGSFPLVSLHPQLPLQYLVLLSVTSLKALLFWFRSVFRLLVNQLLFALFAGNDGVNAEMNMVSDTFNESFNMLSMFLTGSVPGTPAETSVLHWSSI